MKRRTFLKKGLMAAGCMAMPEMVSAGARSAPLSVSGGLKTAGAKCGIKSRVAGRERAVTVSGLRPGSYR